MTTDTTPVTVVGLGLMGQALASTFLRNGHPTTVWNRTAAKATELVAQGARLADSPADAVAASPLVVVCVSNYDAVHELLDPLGDALDGRVLVNLTSGTSEAARQTAEWVTQRGGYLDGAIMAVPPAIGTAEATVFYSGPQAVFDRHESTLRVLGAGTTYLGADYGLSSLHDVALLGAMWGVANSFLQGAALVGTAGVPASTFASIAGPLIGTVNGWLPDLARQIDKGDYAARDATIDTHLGTMEHLVRESESVGVNADLPRLVKALAGRAVADGHGGSDYAAMIEQFRKPSGSRP
ncbi:NAD(P)-dependent oxidoreductase [Plantactinospora endophytica]|uniref:3-hydroxyisobutyrate dehydrogenase n=1 Tax=Plantactinospora endophytica TaxID=673535 RepID=A0ABQ4DWL5_9ACTN|nr:NAD(P)-binding domain-containing protein [Plantactinospora endophytica]GIG86839.1 3-hydroxyisobutyrate dehydrogenase [Plantactinospora endophytica]